MTRRSPDPAKALVSRWKSPAGKIAARAVGNALQAGPTMDELRGYVRELPGADEVAPALDLRGIDLPELVVIKTTDLSGVRFDHAKLNWSFARSTLRGAVFNGATGRNVDFSFCDLTGGTFQNANLPGAIFFSANLAEANLAGIKMRSGQLKDANCLRANFEGADLRLVWAAEADLRGANFTRANFVGASLGYAKWDERTRWAEAQLSWEGTPVDLATQAIAQGASVRSEKPEWELALFDATRAALASETGDVSILIARLTDLRPYVERDHTFAWTDTLLRDASPTQRAAVERAIGKAANNIGALLG